MLYAARTEDARNKMDCERHIEGDKHGGAENGCGNKAKEFDFLSAEKIHLSG